MKIMTKARFVRTMTRRLGKEHDTHSENDGPKKTNAHGDAIRSGIVHCLCAVINTIGCENTECDEELIATVYHISTRFTVVVLGGNLRYNSTTNFHR